jgi:spore germination cell wall hydrolase CwlJ-like protein
MSEIDPNRAQSAENSAASPEDEALLARLIFAEGADHYKIPGALESIGWTVANRVGAPGFRRTLKDVIDQPAQFNGPKNPQWEKAGDSPNLQGEDLNAYAKALTVARAILGGTLNDPTHGATFFYSRQKPEDSPPGWFKREVEEKRLVPTIPDIGKFTFLRPARSQPH